jgi:MarR family transcriptional regulator, transcriptional regulator for hemolysin
MSELVTAHTDVERLNQSLGFLVNGLARLMRNELENRLKEAGLTPTTWTVLMALLEEDRLSQTDLAKKTFLDGATMTRALDLLEAKGYIARVRDEGDRRVQIVVLTDSGHSAANAQACSGINVNAEATSDLTPAERHSLHDFLTRSIRRMSDKSSDGVALAI